MIFVYTSRLGNTDRFVRRVADKIHPRPTTLRLPWSDQPDDTVQKAIDYAFNQQEDIILFTPTYRQTRVSAIGTEYVPQSIVRFLDESCAELPQIRAIVSTGNLSFGGEYNLAGVELSELLEIPLVAKVDMSGLSTDDEKVVNFCQEAPDERLLK